MLPAAYKQHFDLTTPVIDGYEITTILTRTAHPRHFPADIAQMAMQALTRQ